jgi:hypothetical protein
MFSIPSSFLIVVKFAAIDEEVGQLITWYVGFGKYLPCWQVGRVEGV